MRDSRAGTYRFQTRERDNFLIPLIFSFFCVHCAKSRIHFKVHLSTVFMLSLSCCSLWCDVINCGVLGWPLLGRKHSFSGFSGLDERRLGIGYLWHAVGAWAPSDHDVVPFSSACSRGMMGSDCFSVSLYFPQLFFIEVAYFLTGFHFLMCQGIYLEFIMSLSATFE